MMKKKREQEQGKEKQARSRLYTSVLLVLLSLVAVTAATVAWFSIADNTKVKTMGLDIIADTDLRMDLDPHETIEQYVKTLSFEQIAERMQRDKGFSMAETPLEPVTTVDETVFTFENGNVAESTSGAYLEFSLHFMAAKDMIVHLTSANSSNETEDGTAIMSWNTNLAQAMRISFSADGWTWIYDAGMGDTSGTSGQTKIFGLPRASVMKLTDDNAMFSLKEGENKEIKVHIWLEGTDPACTDELKATQYSIRLRFMGEGTGEGTGEESLSDR